MEPTINVVEHLTELRKRLIIVVVSLFMSLCTGFYFSPDILMFIKGQPASIQVVWNVFSLTDGLYIYIKCALLFAVLITLPVLLLQLWQFVRPGLTVEEAKGTIWYVPVSFFLFLLGFSFAYFIVFPMMVQFMNKINTSIGAVETYGIDRYFSLLFSFVFPISIAFEMPVVVLFLTKVGLINPQLLRKVRKHSYLVLVVIGTMISPPDFVSHFSVTIPLILLFEVSILISNWSYNKVQETLPKGGELDVQ
jgi:sec-independent protein translocase protein TatC